MRRTPEVLARTGGEQILDLEIGFGMPELGRDVDHDELGDREPERPAELAGEHFRDEGPTPCPAPRNFVTYMPPSSASSNPRSEPPSRSAVT